jgi:sialic acid synthase SpsE
MGARIFEKHLTLKKGEKRIDYEAAVGYNDILGLREKLDKLIRVLGEGSRFSLNDAEIEYKNREKQLMYSKDIKAGEEITYGCLSFKICSEKSDVEQRDINKIVGCKATKDLEKDKVVEFGDIERGERMIK